MVRSLISVRLISRKYVGNERLLHSHERILSPALHCCTGPLRIFLHKFGRVCTKEEGMLPGSLTDN